MYREYYGLREKPFVLTPDPQFLYMSDSHRTAIDSLYYGIEQREGFIVITGDIGTGKTTICRALLERLDKNVKTAVIFNSFLSEEELLESILLDFGFSSKGRTKKERIDALNKLLIYLLSHGKKAVLIIDEAQNLSIPVLEQIRMLSNLETEKEKMIQIILFGQLELEQKLRSDELKQLNQRIAVRHHLLPLTRTETESYIYQRLMVAGSQGSITFSKSALNEIHKFSKGTPRLINLLCDRALLGGFVEQTYHIDKGILKKAKDSLLGEEENPKPFYSFSLTKSLPSFRIVLSSIFAFLLASMLLTNQGYFALFQNVKNSIGGRIQDIYSQISGTTPLSASTLPLDKERGQDSAKNEPVKDSKRASQEVSK
ncbi:MAG: AAA family ATPase [Thermodesulfobacteriota bacterium]|jgi:general secretion pathway protein A